MPALVECVPNFSEGRDAAVIGELAAAVRDTPGAGLLDQTSDADHNRTVLTFAGTPEAVIDAAVRLAGIAATRIDLRRHTGVHPRLGAMDVCPFVPIHGITLEQCAEVAHWAGNRIWLEHEVPVYFYEAAALREECRPLERIRRGGLVPDLGGARLHPVAGAVVVGARKFLIAFNVNLANAGLDTARRIARSIRESNGGLPKVKALALPLESAGVMQISMNLVDFEVTSILQAYEAIARQAEVVESELIGLAPAAALDASIAARVKLRGWSPEMILENRLAKLHLI
jgi:glutamate formiminotransferase/glutamate formiminotransferase/formiminotetrahydrofolate cyclodeaminase